MTVFIVSLIPSNIVCGVFADWDAAKVFTDQFDLKSENLDIKEWTVKTLDEVKGFFGV